VGMCCDGQPNRLFPPCIVPIVVSSPLPLPSLLAALSSSSSGAPGPSSSPFSFFSLLPMPATADNDPQATSSHMMKTTKRGRPFLKVSLSLVIRYIPSSITNRTLWTSSQLSSYLSNWVPINSFSERFPILSPRAFKACVLISLPANLSKVMKRRRILHR
jgi:hypothetical protein